MKSLYSKIFKVQSELQAVSKGMENPYFKSKYFDVNAVIAELKPLLAKHGLVVLQPLSMKDGTPVIMTVVSDPETGESAGWATPLPQNQDPQKQGGLITYFRRYALTSLFLIQGEEDDDANAASGKAKPEKADTKYPDEPFPSEQKLLKKCPSCGKMHSGPYPKCIDCYLKEKSK